MVSASKAAREAKRAAEGKAPKKTVASRSKAGSKTASGASSVAGDETPPLLDGDGNAVPDDDQPATSLKKMDEVKRLADQMDKHGLSDRVTTGVLSSLKQSRDVKMTSVSLVFHGRVLITDVSINLPLPHDHFYLGFYSQQTHSSLLSISTMLTIYFSRPHSNSHTVDDMVSWERTAVGNPPS
jgi:ATP-binding cassette subfamily F protein 2